MSSEDGDVYIMREGDEGEWVNPRPAREVIADAIVDATDLAADDIEELDEYVDCEDLRAVLESDDDEISFDVEDIEVTVDADGNVDVE